MAKRTEKHEDKAEAKPVPPEQDPTFGEELRNGLFLCGPADTHAVGTIRQYSDGREFIKLSTPEGERWQRTK